jgi:FKBP-type peptidyl-prolyl cis-trans isomerase FkpA
MQPHSINPIFITLLFVLLTMPSFAQDAKSAAAQKSEDEQLLQEYFAKNNIKPQKNSLGLYYTINKEGAGNKILAGETVFVKYTSRLLNGKVFDSNVDIAFHDTKPFVFEVGKRTVIRGWDKGVQQLKGGTAATLYIPSALGYGPSINSPVPENSVLIFDMEIIDVKR